jgi:hypothetical protein
MQQPCSKSNVNYWYKLEVAQATEQNSCCTTHSLFKHPIHNIYTEMLPIHRSYMHLSHCVCPSYQMCQHHKDKAVFLDQTLNIHLVFNERAASLSVSFNDTCHLPVLCSSNNTHNECVLCTGGVTSTVENWNNWRQAYLGNTLSTTSFTQTEPGLDLAWMFRDQRVHALISTPNTTWQCYHERRNGNQVSTHEYCVTLILLVWHEPQTAAGFGNAPVV